MSPFHDFFVYVILSLTYDQNNPDTYDEKVRLATVLSAADMTPRMFVSGISKLGPCHRPLWHWQSAPLRARSQGPSGDSPESHVNITTPPLATAHWPGVEVSPKLGQSGLFPGTLNWELKEHTDHPVEETVSQEASKLRAGTFQSIGENQPGAQRKAETKRSWGVRQAWRHRGP